MTPLVDTLKNVIMLSRLVIFWTIFLINHQPGLSQIMSSQNEASNPLSATSIGKIRCIDTTFNLNQILTLTTYYNNEKLQKSVGSEEILFDYKENVLLKDCRQIFVYSPNDALTEDQTVCNISNGKTTNYSIIYQHTFSANYDTITELHLAQNEIIASLRRIVFCENSSMDTITIFEKFDTLWRPDRKDINHFDAVKNQKTKTSFRFDHQQGWVLASMKSFTYNQLNKCITIEQKRLSPTGYGLLDFSKEIITYDTLGNKIQTESYSFDSLLCAVPEIKATYTYNSKRDHLLSIHDDQWNPTLFQWVPFSSVEMSYYNENDRMQTYKEYVFDEYNKPVLSRSVRYEYFTN
jgi:hypothetical protein